MFDNVLNIVRKSVKDQSFMTIELFDKCPDIFIVILASAREDKARGKHAGSSLRLEFRFLWKAA